MHRATNAIFATLPPFCIVDRADASPSLVEFSRRPVFAVDHICVTNRVSALVRGRVDRKSHLRLARDDDRSAKIHILRGGGSRLLAPALAYFGSVRALLIVMRPVASTTNVLGQPGLLVILLNTHPIL